MMDEVLTALGAITKGALAGELESDTLDFKEETSPDDTLRAIADAVLCFANSSGGTVVVGVKDKMGGTDAFVGTQLTQDSVRKRVYELTEPPLVVDVDETTAGTARLLLVRVGQSPEIHADKKGRAPRRIGTDCHGMTPTEQARLREERQGFDWSGQPSGTTVTEVMPAALAAARERLGAFTDGRRELANLGDRELLTALGVLTSAGRLTRAGAIMFCSSPGGAPRTVYQYRPTPGGEPTAIERLAGPLVLEFQRVMQFTAARRQLTAATLPDGQQIHIEDFPDLAVREAIANGVIHRDYHLSGPVSIEHSPEIFVVTSPGPLVFGVTPSNILTHPSKPRNLQLAKVARMLGLAEEVGRGVDRMYREMIRSGRDVPKIASSVDYVRVTLVGGAPNTQIARFVAQLPSKERDDTDAMLVLFSLMSSKTINAIDLASFVQKTPEETEAVLRRLGDEGVAMLEPTRESSRRSHPNYRLRSEALRLLGSAVPYQRRTTDEIDRKVIEHVREYGEVTNRTVRNLLDVSTQRAAAILGDLVSREVLVKTSDAQRGPSVEYGPGSRFPHQRRVQRRDASEQLLLESDPA